MTGTSVRLRITLWNIIILILVLFGFLVVVHLSVRSYQLSSMDRRLAEVGERAALAAPHFGHARRESGHQRSRLGRGGRVVRFFDRNGRLLGSFGGAENSQAQPWDKSAFLSAISGKDVYSMVKDEDGSPLRVYSRPVSRGEGSVAAVQVAMSFAEVQDLLRRLTWTLVGLVPFVLLIAGLAGASMTSRMLKPIRQIVDASSTLSVKDLSQRIPVVSDDEFGHLANTINSLLGRIEQVVGELTQSIERERRFTADASHELRTPLTAVKANTSLVLRGDRTAAEYREALEAIDHSADTMSRLVHDLLLLARTDSGRLAMTFGDVDPNELCRESSEMVFLGKAGATLNIKVDESAGAIHGDARQLRRLLVNLLDNAFRHTPASGTVTLDVNRKGSKMVLAITDTGEGIPPEHLLHLGERFYRVDAARSRERGGSGLGLAICKSIVDAHKGTMMIDSTLGEGTSVTIVLPAS